MTGGGALVASEPPGRESSRLELLSAAIEAPFALRVHDRHRRNQWQILHNRLRYLAMPKEILDSLQKRGMPPPIANEPRRFMRKPLCQEAVCEVIPTLAAIERKHSFYRVHLRDISRGGISFLHFEQLFPQERVVLWTRSGKLKSLVCRCVKRGENAYEVGGIFE